MPKVGGKDIAWRRMLLSAGLPAAAFSLSVVAFGWTAGHNAAVGKPVAALIASVPDPLDYFSLRSPGLRGHGKLIQTKRKLAANKPFERVLSNVRQAPAPSIDDPESPLVQTFSGEAPPFNPGFAPNPPAPPQSPNPQLPSLLGDPTLTGTVPEPDTWITMIFGMAMIAAGLRSRRRDRLVAGQAPG